MHTEYRRQYEYGRAMHEVSVCYIHHAECMDVCNDQVVSNG